MGPVGPQARPREVLGGSWGGLGGVLGGSWGGLGGLGGVLGGPEGGPEGVLGDALRSLLEDVKISEQKIALRRDLEASWDHLGPVLGRLGAVLGRLGAVLGPSWGHLGPILDHLRDLKRS